MEKSICVHVPNDAGVFNARRGIWKGVNSVFTHRNPKTGKLWGEDIPVFSRIYAERGMWVPADEVKFVD